VSAFDLHRPPSAADIDTCVHCGFCLPTCPTYVLWGEEMDSPRGRIVLMDAALRETDVLSDAMVTHWDRCLGCMACVTACPSGVAYDRLLEDTRPQVERNHRRGPGERLLRRALFATFTNPRRLARLAPFAGAASRLGARRLGRALPDGSRLGAVMRLTPRAAHVPLMKLTPARGERRGRAGLLLGCVNRVFFAEANRASAEVLAAEGWDVYAPQAPACCGALHLHSGEEPAALARMREAMAAFAGCDVVVTNAAGCGSALKDAGRLLGDAEARAFSAKVRDVSELLIEPLAARGPLALRVAYHDACHLAHAQGIRMQPRAALASIPGLELVEPAEQGLCCGSAGVYNILEPKAAADLGRRKAAALAETGAEVVAAGNPGCTLQIRTYLEELGWRGEVVHPAELIARSAGLAPHARNGTTA
jgi:glycolate oxidase iron-sulfur subunit